MLYCIGAGWLLDAARRIVSGGANGFAFELGSCGCRLISRGSSVGDDYSSAYMRVSQGEDGEDCAGV